MGTGGDPDRPALPQLLTQGLSPGLHFVTQLDIELDGTGHRQPLTTDAEPCKALGIVLMLAKQMGQRPTEGIERSLKTGIALAGAFG